MVVVDGPLSHHRDVKNAVGYIKTQKVQYLPIELRGVLTSLLPGFRTPLFLTTTSWSRYSWYLRLANHSGPAGGLVRCEIDGDAETVTAIRSANMVSASLPRFASERHKDPRAPQNLYPIGGAGAGAEASTWGPGACCPSSASRLGVKCSRGSVATPPTAVWRTTDKTAVCRR